ncbi:hypothetical protein K456DRAFT_1258863 [Colletotrichum gloeosporioides 23]|nr:hypothetical protein K456DRAFT_1258863 [Colletotrichum gloeosporioides 23]
MQEATNQAKPTTNRRRGRNGGGKAAGQKMYASENDMANVSNSAFDQFGPHTPQKSCSGSPDPQSAAGAQTGSKQRSRNKPRAKNPSANPVASPDTRQNRRSTPQSIPVSNKPNTAAAFAGATFHASPAPSALPMPSFYSKSIPESPGNPGMRREVQQQPSPPVTEHEAPTPHHPSTVPVARESPLDAIFRADRAEKEKARRVSSLHSSSRPQGPVSPPAPALRDSPFAAKPSSAELDGFPGKPLGPAFSTPYQDRIRAARAGPSQPCTPKASENSPSEDRSEALKKYLFGGKGMTGSPQPSPSIPSTPHASNGIVTQDEEARSSDLRVMEDSLRRILKLDSPLAAAKSGERPLYS